MKTLFQRAESYWRLVVAYFRAKGSHLGSNFITGGGTLYQWVLVATPPCPCSLPSISANLLCQPKGNEADAHVRTRMSQSNNLSPSCQLRLFQFQPGVILTFSLLLILIPSLFPPRHHLVGNPKIIIVEECWKEWRNHLSTPPLHRGPDRGQGMSIQAEDTVSFF